MRTEIRRRSPEAVRSSDRVAVGTIAVVAGKAVPPAGHAVGHRNGQAGARYRIVAVDLAMGYGIIDERIAAR